MFHSHAEIILFLSGEGKFVVDGKTHLMKRGDLCFTFPYSIHEYKQIKRGSIAAVQFSPKTIGNFEQILLSNKPASPYLSKTDEFVPIIDKIISLLESGGDIETETAKSYLQALIGELLLGMELVHIDKTDVRITQKMLIYCSDNFNKDITVNDVADALFVSKSYITKIFSTRLGCSFRDYINLLRIREAKKLLETTDEKIITIMLECGFKNQSTFNRVFYELCGEKPKEYRKSFQKTK